MFKIVKHFILNIKIKIITSNNTKALIFPNKQKLNEIIENQTIHCINIIN